MNTNKFKKYISFTIHKFNQDFLFLYNRKKVFLAFIRKIYLQL